MSSHAKKKHWPIHFLESLENEKKNTNKKRKEEKKYKKERNSKHFM